MVAIDNAITTSPARGSKRLNGEVLASQARRHLVELAALRWGLPSAVLSTADEDTVEETLAAFRQARAARAVLKAQMQQLMGIGQPGRLHRLEATEITPSTQ